MLELVWCVYIPPIFELKMDISTFGSVLYWCLDGMVVESGR